MKTKALSLVAFLALLISILACGTNGVVVSTPTARQRGAPGVPPVASTEPAAEMVTSRSNPAPVGSTVLADDMQFVVTGIVRPADALVNKGNPYNDAPGAGNEYMFVTISVVCKSSTDDQCKLHTYNLHSLGADGILKDDAVVSGVDGLLDDTTFYGGAKVSGNVPFIVTKGDANILFVYQTSSGDAFYLALPTR